MNLLRTSSILLLGTLVAGALGFACATGDDTGSSDAEQNAADPLVISQVYGAAGALTTTPKNDYVELFNRSTKTAISLEGLSLQFAAKNEPFTTDEHHKLDFPKGAKIEPGHYFLIQLGGSNNGTPTPTADLVGTFNIGNAGSLAIVPSGALLEESADAAAALAGSRALLGYGKVDQVFAAGAPAPSLANENALFRNDNGCAATGNNSKDYAKGTPAPRNGSSPVTLCASDDADAGADAAATDPDASELDASAPTEDAGKAEDAGTPTKDAGTPTKDAGAADAGPKPTKDAGAADAGSSSADEGDDEEGDDPTPPVSTGKKKKTGVENSATQPIASSKSDCAMTPGAAPSSVLGGLAGLGLALAALGRRRRRG